MKQFLKIRDRAFEIAACTINHSEGLWSVEIETVARDFGELWQPRLYHQGMRLAAESPAALSGSVINPSEAGPEIPLIYVFGHHDVYSSCMEFGAINEGTIELAWIGKCDIYWDDEYKDDVPFECRCVGTTRQL